uniref:Cdc23 domain-containing protein n=1 Tax=Daphnia galeata TaxID=27404 RepID=A0A8J2WM19_9CRUS|nr:unnamed protein product [Daphnia galeata]
MLLTALNINSPREMEGLDTFCKKNFQCAHYTQECTDPVKLFLHYYSRYMAGEKTIVEDESDKSNETKLAHLKLLHHDLGRLRNLLLDGMVIYAIHMTDLPHSLQVLQDSVNLNPLNWAACH